jgi:hypothetical protein
LRPCIVGWLVADIYLFSELQSEEWPGYCLLWDSNSYQ